MDRGDLVTGAFKSTEVGIHGNDTRILLLHSMLFREWGGGRDRTMFAAPLPLDGRWAGKNTTDCIVSQSPRHSSNGEGRLGAEVQPALPSGQKEKEGGSAQNKNKK
ncbi:hypothetical protein CEXT_594141 [Caerostris extrusa]|uniref:Uncharacterized protein n=1 Tax=Caerostris extrusa TaxID=172846 RepID=A0AAV4T1Q8_CAEEX|nr:hypothetical protein CEXT_594141 [Caerostris extrusa]